VSDIKNIKRIKENLYGIYKKILEVLNMVRRAENESCNSYL
jgi:hypothetical protein